MKNSDTIRALLEGSLEIKVLGATVHVQSRHTREQIEKSFDMDSAEQLRRAMTAGPAATNVQIITMCILGIAAAQ